MPFKDKVKQAAAAARHYERNKAACVARAAALNKLRREESIAIVMGHLEKHPCVDCGEADPIVLEFDHRDPATKLYSIGQLISGKVCGIAGLVAEIAKCDVRCANCHRRKTAKDRGYFKTL